MVVIWSHRCLMQSYRIRLELHAAKKQEHVVNDKLYKTILVLP